MGAKGTSKINLERFSILHALGYDDAKISRHLKCSSSTATYIRKHILKYKPVIEDLQLQPHEIEVLVGTLLGDSCLSYTHSGCRFPNLTFCHCKKQEIFANIKFRKLHRIMSSLIERRYKEETVIRGKHSKVQPILFGTGKNMKCLVEYRNAFYPKGIKIIPISFIEDKFTAISLAFLFMDEGCKNCETINLNMQSYSKENLIEFTAFLQRKFDIEFIIKKDKTLYLRYNSRKKFLDLVLPYITEDMIYKLKSSINSVNLEKS